jgi:hypothetical protein
MMLLPLTRLPARASQTSDLKRAAVWVSFAEARA